MEIKKWWNKLKDWQKGAVVGGFIWILLIFINLIIEGVKMSRLPEFLLFISLFYGLPLILLGMFVGFLSRLIKNKFIFIGGLSGLAIGVFSVLLFETQVGKTFLYFLATTLRIFFPLDNLGPGAMALAPLFILFNIILWSLIGLIFGFIKRKYKLKWFIIGGIIGGIWGLLSFFIGIFSLREPTLKSIFLYLPFYIAYEIIGERALLLSPIIGILFGVIIVFIIKKISKKKDEK